MNRTIINEELHGLAHIMLAYQDRYQGEDIADEYSFFDGAIRRIADELSGISGTLVECSKQIHLQGNGNQESEN